MLAKSVIPAIGAVHPRHTRRASGPHCNAADKAAARLARLGRPVKKMIGGKIGWLDEGFELATS